MSILHLLQITHVKTPCVAACLTSASTGDCVVVSSELSQEEIHWLEQECLQRKLEHKVLQLQPQQITNLHHPNYLTYADLVNLSCAYSKTMSWF